jgi:Zn-dependent alcohol dehydrogenase
MPKPKIGEALIKIKACGVCHSDLHVIKEELKFPTPCVLGHEVSGELVEINDPRGKSNLKIGDRVVGTFIMPCTTCVNCGKGRDDLCTPFFEFNRVKGTLYDDTTRLFSYKDNSPIYMYSMGGLAEYCVTPIGGVYKLPDNVPLMESCIIGCAIFTAFGTLKHGAQLVPGDSVAIIGAGGGVGLNCVQLASKVFGASKIIAIDVSDDKLSLAKSFGATDLINPKTEDPIKKLMAITNGQGVDVCVEALGRKATMEQAINLVKDGGKAVITGLAPSWEKAELELTRLVRRQIRIIGAYGARARQDVPVIMSLLEKGVIDVTGGGISRVFSLEEAGMAYQLLSEGKINGRAIVKIS